MPGILYHLTFAGCVFNAAPFLDEKDKINFLAGNLIPDLAKDKMKSHFRTSASIFGLFVPNMAIVKYNLFDLRDPIKFGMYCHLYLDYYFIEHFLIPSFIWDTRNKTVISRKNGKSWTEEEFFSKDGLYRGYSEINPMLIENGFVSMDEIEKIPKILPSTKMEVFDERLEKSWKAELNGYLSNRRKYTGDILDFEELTHFIKGAANKLVFDISSKT